MCASSPCGVDLELSTRGGGARMRCATLERYLGSFSLLRSGPLSDEGVGCFDERAERAALCDLRSGHVGRVGCRAPPTRAWLDGRAGDATL